MHRHTSAPMHWSTGTLAHQHIGTMEQYYEICNINIIVQIWMCPCGDGRSSVEYLSCIFVTNIYAVYFGLDFLLNIYINTRYIITHGNFLANILCQCASGQHNYVFRMHLEKYFYVNVSMLMWRRAGGGKWKSHIINCPFIHDFCADAGMSATMKW